MQFVARAARVLCALGGEQHGVTKGRLNFLLD